MEAQNSIDIKVVSSLGGLSMVENRRCGNTTRIINNVIELMFQGHEVVLVDVKPVDSGTEAFTSSKRLYEKIERRIRSEHPRCFEHLIKDTWSGVYSVRFSDEKIESLLYMKEEHAATKLKPCAELPELI